MSRPHSKLAAIVTSYRKHSDAQHIVDRFLYGYGWSGMHHQPEIDVVSLFIDQAEAGDLSRSRAAQFPSMKIYPTIAEAVTLGTSKLAVDGVMIIAEGGLYARNEKGQWMYPRWEFFEQVVKVFKDSGRSVPIFNDRHLSWNWDWARQMYDTSREMDFAYMAGSSVSVTWRIPSVEMPMGSHVREALCVGYGDIDSDDFRALEAIQCMVERRHGGETGVKWVQAYQGDKFWSAMSAGIWSRRLMNAALCRSHTLTPARFSFNDIFPTDSEMRRLINDPIAYQYEHTDGLKCTMLLMNGLVQDFNFAADVEGMHEPLSTQMYLPATDGLASYFSALVNHMEKMYLTGKSPYPVERTLLATGVTSAGVESLYHSQTRYKTPHLAIKYHPAQNSTFERT